MRIVQMEVYGLSLHPIDIPGDYYRPDRQMHHHYGQDQGNIGHFPSGGGDLPQGSQAQSKDFSHQYE